MPRGAVESYQTEPRVVLDKAELVNAVRVLHRRGAELVALRLIRAGYRASLKEALVILAEMLTDPRPGLL